MLARFRERNKGTVMQAILPRSQLRLGLIFKGLTKDKAVSVTASIAVNLIMIVAFASIADFDGPDVKQAGSLVVVGLSGTKTGSDVSEEMPAASLPAPAPAAEPEQLMPSPEVVQPAEKPLEQKIALLQPPEPTAEHTQAAPPPATIERRPSPEQLREATDQQRQAQEEARMHAAEQAQSEARATASAAPGVRSSVPAGGGGGYKTEIWQHLQRFRRPNSVGAGATLVRFTIDDGGGALNLAVARSSGSSIFDREALQMVRRAAPFPKPPQGAGRVFEFEIKGQ
ncbi:MAG: hypothetical protein JWQ16_883 [Novosphingobium sp.]|nr:hypothetical protein [Novosphingobium sp.]